MLPDSFFKDTPSQIDDALLEQRVQALRDGDSEQIQPICVMLIRWTLGIAKRYRSINQNEVSSKALLELVKEVTRAQEKLTDNNIRGYLSFRIGRRLRDFIKEDKVVKIRTTTLRKLERQGKEVILPVQNYDPHNLYGTENKPEYPRLEFREALSLLPKSKREEEFIQLRLEGLNTKEIGAKWDRSPTAVNNMKRDMCKRMLKMLEDD
jgi:DNA-directed RNA polymerase specialized sigma24 family protein